MRGHLAVEQGWEARDGRFSDYCDIRHHNNMFANESEPLLAIAGLHTKQTECCRTTTTVSSSLKRRISQQSSFSAQFRIVVVRISLANWILPCMISNQNRTGSQKYASIKRQLKQLDWDPIVSRFALEFGA